MTLRLYYHPFSSYCQKVLVALYEREVPFERAIVDLPDPEARAALERLWPLAKFPVLRDEARDLTVPESSAIVTYLDRAHPGPPPMMPGDADEALQVQIWDRFFDNYVETPLQKVVTNCFRPEGAGDAHGVEEAKVLLGKAWAMLDAQLADGRDWVAGGDFSLADCGAGPALFYANIIQPFAGHGHVEAYYERLLERPSFARCVEEARPYRDFFPLAWPESYG